MEQKVKNHDFHNNINLSHKTISHTFIFYLLQLYVICRHSVACNTKINIFIFEKIPNFNEN